MMLLTAVAAMLAVPTSTPTTPKPPPIVTVDVASSKSATSGKSAADKFDPMKLLGMFDKLFPAGPEPEPQRLALSRSATKALLDDGSYVRMMDDIMGGIVERVLDAPIGELAGPQDKKSAAAAATIREGLRKDDPHFDERMAITRKIATEEVAKVAIYIEPKLREGLARSLARRLDTRQLSDLDAFLSTDSGRAFGRESMTMWFDVDVMRSMMMTMPDIFMAMPGAMKRIEAATAHLPKPKKKTTAKK